MLEGSNSFSDATRSEVGTVISNDHKVFITPFKKYLHRPGKPLPEGIAILHSLVKMKHRKPGPPGFLQGLPRQVFKNTLPTRQPFSSCIPGGTLGEDENCFGAGVQNKVLGI